MPAIPGIYIAQVAAVCHEANRAYCVSIGDLSQPSWDTAPEWQRKSAIDGVVFHLDQLSQGREVPPSASHDSWLEAKRADGWKYGPVKDAEAKEHPCFVPYEELPLEQKLKDYIFGGIVRSFYAAAVPVDATRMLSEAEIRAKLAYLQDEDEDLKDPVQRAESAAEMARLRWVLGEGPDLVRVPKIPAL